MSFNSPPISTQTNYPFHGQTNSPNQVCLQRACTHIHKHTCMSHILVDALPTTRPQQHPSTSFSAHTNTHIHTLAPRRQPSCEKSWEGTWCKQTTLGVHGGPISAARLNKVLFYPEETLCQIRLLIYSQTK